MQPSLKHPFRNNKTNETVDASIYIYIYIYMRISKFRFFLTIDIPPAPMIQSNGRLFIYILLISKLNERQF